MKQLIFATILLITAGSVFAQRKPGGWRPPHFYDYTGDLSVKMERKGKPDIDPATHMIRVWYTMTVRDSAGNLPFSFVVRTTEFGQNIRFHVVNNLNNDGILVTNLANNSSRQFDGYFLVGNGNATTSKQIWGVLVTASIIDEVGGHGYVYRIQQDYVPANNSCDIGLPLNPVVNTPVDPHH